MGLRNLIYRQHSLPGFALSKRFPYAKEINTLGLFRLLLFEIWHGGEIVENMTSKKN
jgi:hypothetical protein